MKQSFTVITCCCLLTASAVADGPELRPDVSAPCFLGAYYRKAVSSFDTWTGIDTVVKLPVPDYDMSRVRASGRPLDNASIYIGGRAGDQEIDCGVNWEIIREADGTVSKVGKAFRPFIRNEQWISGPAKPEYYFNPGDIIRMRVETTEPGKLEMQIHLLARAGESARTREFDLTALTEADILSSYTATFDAGSYRPGGVQQFKRVNGMDQSGNEGKPVQPTNSQITDARWLQTWLLREDDRLPMAADRFTDMRCPDPTHIQVAPIGDSGEIVTLTGSPKSE